MKTLILVLLVLGVAGTGGYYAVTGRLPWVEPSPDEAQVAALRTAFTGVREQWQQAGRAAALGTDPSGAAETALAGLERLEGALADLTPALKSTAALNQANQLRSDMASFRSRLR